MRFLHALVELELHKAALDRAAEERDMWLRFDGGVCVVFPYLSEFLISPRMLTSDVTIANNSQIEIVIEL
jgi:hypothetical protein